MIKNVLDNFSSTCLHSSGMLCTVSWYLVTYVLRQPVDLLVLFLLIYFRYATLQSVKLHLGNISKGIYLRCTDPWTSDFLYYLTLEDGTNRFSGDVGNQLPTYAAFHPRRAKATTTSKQKPEILLNAIYLYAFNSTVG